VQAVAIALIAALPPTLAVIVSRFQSRKQIQEVHVLVNDRAEKQDQRIADLEARLRARDTLSP